MMSYMVMSTATDQLKLRKIIPMQMTMKLMTICSLEMRIPVMRMGRLMRRLTPQMTGSIHMNRGLSLTDMTIPPMTPSKPPTQTTTPNMKVTPSSVIGDS